AGAVDPAPERCPRLADLRAAGTPIFTELGDFYAARRADLAVISSPHHFHARQTIAALEAGSQVLCEKPAAGTIQDALAMASAERRTGRWAAIGYQWSFSDAVQALKADILDGRFGRPLRLDCLYTWPRGRAYYARNSWAGRLSTDDGSWVLDGPANNAFAHDLHNIFYILGPDIRSCSFPVEIQGELYRTNAIENCDTAAARILTDGGAEVLFWVSHASLRDRGPVLRFEFEKGMLTADGRGSELKAVFRDGKACSYGNPDAAPMKKIGDVLRAVRTGIPPVCGVAAASGQTMAVNGLQDSRPDVVDIPADFRIMEGIGQAEWIRIRDLDEAWERCREERRLPSENGVAWARAGRRIDLRGYRRFPGPRS
ncbi:MAG: Gfo/Idh/MocA family oxidoreductase, partial [Candidatus Aminicenantales bacterium]